MRVMSVRAKPIIAESYRHHGHQKRREIPFTRERSKVRSLVRPPALSRTRHKPIMAVMKPFEDVKKFEVRNYKATPPPAHLRAAMVLQLENSKTGFLRSWLLAASGLFRKQPSGHGSRDISSRD